MKTLDSILRKMLCIAILFNVFNVQKISAINQELTLFVGYDGWAEYPIVEIMPINEQIVKVVVLNKNQVYNSEMYYNNTYYFKKGQKLYQNSDNIFDHNYFFPLEKYKGKKSVKDHIITILSFGYNYITIKQEDVVLTEEERARQMKTERINSFK